MGRSQARVRARGKGHRRRYSKSHVSRSSVYETIEEEVGPSPSRSLASKKDDTTRRQAIFVIDSDTLSVHSKGEESVWDDERGIVALRKFYALRDEAENTVLESKKIWMDIPFSIFALQCKFHFNQTNVSRLMPCPAFQPPHHPAGMQALLEHSVQSYGPLPSELRPRHVRCARRAQDLLSACDKHHQTDEGREKFIEHSTSCCFHSSTICSRMVKAQRQISGPQGECACQEGKFGWTWYVRCIHCSLYRDIYS